MSVEVRHKMGSGVVSTNSVMHTAMSARMSLNPIENKYQGVNTNGNISDLTNKTVEVGIDADTSVDNYIDGLVTLPIATDIAEDVTGP